MADTDNIMQELLDTVDKMYELRLKLYNECVKEGLEEGDPIINLLNEITDGVYNNVEDIKARIEELKEEKEAIDDKER